MNDWQTENRLRRYREGGTDAVLEHNAERVARAGHARSAYLAAEELLLGAEIAYLAGDDTGGDRMAQAAANMAHHYDHGSTDATDLGWLINRAQNDRLNFGWEGAARAQFLAAAWCRRLADRRSHTLKPRPPNLLPCGHVPGQPLRKCCVTVTPR